MPNVWIYMGMRVQSPMHVCSYIDTKEKYGIW